MLGDGHYPRELERYAVMDRIGGYAALLALEADARAYDDVVTIMRGEAEAAVIRRARQQADARAGGRRAR